MQNQTNINYNYLFIASTTHRATSWSVQRQVICTLQQMKTVRSALTANLNIELRERISWQTHYIYRYRRCCNHVKRIKPRLDHLIRRVKVSEPLEPIELTRESIVWKCHHTFSRFAQVCSVFFMRQENLQRFLIGRAHGLHWSCCTDPLLCCLVH